MFRPDRPAALAAITIAAMALTTACGGGTSNTPSSTGASATAATTSAATASSSADVASSPDTGITGGAPSPTTTVALTQPTGCSGNDAGPPAGMTPPSGMARPSGPMPAQGTPSTPTYADVAYATVSPSQVLDLFVPTGSGPFPLIIKIHGGAFKAGDKTMEEGDIGTLTDAGYAVASLNYRLSCEALFPAAVQDVKAATRFLRANATTYNLNPDAFASWGESAGANLAAMIGASGTQTTFLDDPALGNADTSSAVQAVVGWYGPYDFLTMDQEFADATPAACTAPQAHDPSNSPESQYLGAAIQSVPDIANSAGPGYYLATADGIPPFMLAAGDSDCLVPNQQSQQFNDALLAAGAQSTFTLLNGAGHGDPLFQSTRTQPALAFLNTALGV